MTYKEVAKLMKRADYSLAQNNGQMNQAYQDILRGLQPLWNGVQQVTQPIQQGFNGLWSLTPLLMMGGMAMFNQSQNNKPAAPQAPPANNPAANAPTLTKPGQGNNYQTTIKQFNSPVKAPQGVPKGSQAYKNSLRIQMQKAKQVGLSAQNDFRPFLW